MWRIATLGRLCQSKLCAIDDPDTGLSAGNYLGLILAGFGGAIGRESAILASFWPASALPEG
jgi:hypothetical protein